MAGPLTDTEKAQIKDHGNWGGGDVPAAYVQVYVDPTLTGLSDEAVLAIVRGHLTRCNTVYTQLESAQENFGLDQAGSIKFNPDEEARLWAMYRLWRTKLYDALYLKVNASGSSRRNRAIRQ